MKKGINRKLHNYAKNYHLSISATVQLLIEDFHGEIKRIEEEHREKRREQRESHQKQQEVLKDRIKQQGETIAELKEQISNLKKSPRKSARNSRILKFNTADDESR
jgi:molybdopterin converting factor small subunit